MILFVICQDNELNLRRVRLSAPITIDLIPSSSSDFLSVTASACGVLSGKIIR